MSQRNLNELFLPKGEKRRSGIIWDIEYGLQLVIWPGTTLEDKTCYNYSFVEKSTDKTILTKTNIPGEPVLRDGTYPENILTEICQECAEHLQSRARLYTTGAKHIRTTAGIA